MLSCDVWQREGGGDRCCHLPINFILFFPLVVDIFPLADSIVGWEISEEFLFLCFFSLSFLLFHFIFSVFCSRCWIMEGK